MEYGSLTSVARPKSGELISICMCVSRSNKGTLRLKVELVTLGIIGAVIFLRCTAKYSSKDSGAYTGTPSSLKMYDPAYPSSHACWPFGRNVTTDRNIRSSLSGRTDTSLALETMTLRLMLAEKSFSAKKSCGSERFKSPDHTGSLRRNI